MLQPGLLLVHTCLEVSRLRQAAMKVAAMMVRAKPPVVKT